MYALVIKDKSTEDSKLKFKTFEAAAEHARMIIIPQIAEATKDALEQDDPSPWMEDVKEMLDLIPELYQDDKERFGRAIEDWAKFARDDNYGDMWVDFI